MRKIGLFAVMLAMALALGMFAGCEGTVQEIEGSVSINDQAPPQVEKVTITPTTDKRYYIVRWDAVEGDVSYSVYYKQDKKNSMLPLYNVGTQNLYKYDAVADSNIPNDDLDKWSSWISLDNLRANIKKGGDYRIGVRTSFGANVGSSERVSSEVQWSDSFKITDLPNISKPTVTPNNENSTTSYTVTWTGGGGADEYEILAKSNYYSSGFVSVGTAQKGSISYTVYSFSLSSNNASSPYRFKVRALSNDITVIPSESDWSDSISQ